MKLIQVALRSFDGNITGLSRQFLQLSGVRAMSTDNPFGNVTDGRNNSSFESADDFEQRIFGGFSGKNPADDAFFQKLDRVEKAHGKSGFGSGTGGNNSPFLDGLDDSFNTLSDGMDGKLKKAATYFEFDPEEIKCEDYTYRPDVQFRSGDTYETKDLDITQPRPRKPFRRFAFETTTKEALRKADFRNVRFLANFITEAGIIIKRSQTGISAKAQRKVAREIKTARAFGLMPFTTMGQDQFVYGNSREDRDDEEEYEYYMDPNPIEDLPVDLP